MDDFNHDTGNFQSFGKFLFSSSRASLKNSVNETRVTMIDRSWWKFIEIDDPALSILPAVYRNRIVAGKWTN